MKKLFFMVCCAALLMTGCKDGKNAPGLASVQQTDSLNDVIAQKDSEINEMMGTLNVRVQAKNRISRKTSSLLPSA